MSTPPTAPSSAEYPTSHVKMYPLGSDTRRHGWMRMPMTPVMYPPVRNEILLGHRLAKSLAGLTTLAAMLVASVARHSDASATTRSTGFLKRVRSTTGSQMVSP